MKRLLVRRGAVGLALGALAATGLASVAAPAHAAVTDAYVGASVEAHDNSGGCAADVVGAPEPAPLPWSDNGVPVTQSHTQSGTFTAPGEDITTVTGTSTSTVSATPLTGGPATIKMSGAATAKAAPTKPDTTVCEGHAHSGFNITGKFTLPQPMWASVTMNSVTKGPDASGTLTIGLADGGLSIGAAPKATAVVTALLPAGPIEMGLEVEADAYGEDPGQYDSSASLSATIELQPLGAASAVSGKGAGYTQFGARDCATGNVAAAITKKAKKKAKQVVIAVNGAKVAKFKGKKLKKRSLVLPAAPASAAEVVATITLKNGKKVTVTRSYLACS